MKDKATLGLFWSFIDSLANQGIQFIIGVILARILSPSEFGTVGIITIFISISQSIIDCGFSNALIRKKDCNKNDYSTVFIFNLFVSLILYFILFSISINIGKYFNNDQLIPLIKVLSIGLIFNSLGIIQRTIIIKSIDFKSLTKVSLFSSLGSGIISITVASYGYGVWSLVWLSISKFAFNSILLNYYSKWKPTLIFDVKSFRELFSFGGKLFISGMIDTIYRNIYFFLIGKYFSSTELGYYSRADQFQAIPSQNLLGIVSKVSFPLLSTIQDDINLLRATYIKLIRSTMFVTFILMLGMASVSESMVLTLIGNKWLPCVEYIQILCFAGMFYPLHAINLNILQILGRSDIYLKVEILKKILSIPAIVIGIFYGIRILLIGLVINTLISLYINSYWSSRFIEYSFVKQIKDILPSFIIALVISSIVFIFGKFINTIPIVILILQICLGSILTFIYCELSKNQDYIYLKNIVFHFLKINNNGKTY
ncbi:lipopolysaccharide biosynthesis protein [Bacteroidota bacterium]